VRQEGFAGQTVNLEVLEAGKLIATTPVTFDRPEQTMNVRVNFAPRTKGVKEYTFGFPPPRPWGMRSARNNTQSRVILVEDRKPKILYLEGEPRWDYKFIRRAVHDDPGIELHCLLRTSENKFYRQGMDTEKSLEAGFPKAEELFEYSAVILAVSKSASFPPRTPKTFTTLSAAAAVDC